MAKKKRIDTQVRLITGGVIVLISLVALFYSMNSTKYLEEDSLEKVYVTLEKEPYVKNFKIKSSNYYKLVLRFKEFKDSILIGGLQFEATKMDSISSLHKGSKLWILLDKDYQKQIRDDELVDLYSFGTTSEVYLDLNDLNKSRKEYKKFAYSLSLCLLGLIPFLFINKKIKYLEIKMVAAFVVWSILLWSILNIII